MLGVKMRMHILKQVPFTIKIPGVISHGLILEGFSNCETNPSGRSFMFALVALVNSSSSSSKLEHYPNSVAFQNADGLWEMSSCLPKPTQAAGTHARLN